MDEKDYEIATENANVGNRPVPDPEPSVKVKGTVNPKVDVKALRDFKLRLKSVKAKGEFDVDFGDGSSMEAELKVKFEKGGKVDVEKAAFSFSKKF